MWLIVYREDLRLHSVQVWCGSTTIQRGAAEPPHW